MTAIETVVQLVAEGLSDDQIAKRLKVRPWRIYRIRRDLGLLKRRGPNRRMPRDPQRLHRIQTLRATGLSYRAIGKELGCSAAAIHAYLRYWTAAEPN